MNDNDEMYCILCHGRGLDSNDHTCRRCKGTGYEPESFELGRGPAGCQALQFIPFTQAEPSRQYARVRTMRNRSKQRMPANQGVQASPLAPPAKRG